MTLGNRILLMMLLITVGTAGALAWVVTLNVTRYETRRADERISEAIGRYVQHIEDRHHQIERIVRALMEAPAARSQLQAADEAQDAAAKEQLRQEVLGRTVQTELEGPEGNPAFHVVVNLAGEVVSVVAPGSPAVEAALSSEGIRWPVDAVANPGERLVSYYVSTPAGLFLAMGVPLHTQLDQPASHAYFVGFRVDDWWVRRQLVSGRMGQGASDAPLSAWFVVNGAVVARASSDADDQRIGAFVPGVEMRKMGHTVLPSSRSLAAYDTVAFENAGERYIGQSFDLAPAGAKSGRLVLASSFDQALAPLRSLQRQILLCTLVACAAAVVACRILAGRIARPVQELVAGTRRVAAGKFERPVDIVRRDEFGQLADAFNAMAGGLRERDSLRDERTKIERDLALARKIQMDILPKHIPSCPGYDLAAYSLPAEQTGGDIYDLVALAVPEEEGPSALVVLLADATGHGVGPALSVTQVRAMLRMGVRLRAAIDDVLNQINGQLCADLDGDRFVTAFLGMLEPGRHCVRYHSAGQAPLLHFKAAERELVWLDSSMLPLGIAEDPQDEGVQHVAMEPGDLMILLTDGFYEFADAGGEQFGRDRVGEVILRHYAEPAKVILAEMLTATKAFAADAPQLDDMTALVIKRQPTGARGGDAMPRVASADGAVTRRKPEPAPEPAIL